MTVWQCFIEYLLCVFVLYMGKSGGGTQFIKTFDYYYYSVLFTIYHNMCVECFFFSAVALFQYFFREQ